MWPPSARSVIAIGTRDFDLEGRKGVCSRRPTKTDNTKACIPFEVTLLDHDAKACFARHIRELRAVQQDIRQCITRVNARQGRRFAEAEEGTLFHPEWHADPWKITFSVNDPCSPTCDCPGATSKTSPGDVYYLVNAG
jgi:hypothetical protein